jgi:acetyltransferase-like isoleucine patch superfamily enzyme
MVALVAVTLIRFVREPGWASFGIFVFATYLFPPLLARFMQLFYPLQYGKHPLRESVGGNAWIISFRCQMIYGIVPMLESIITMIPGVYSAWLRLWGSKIGRGVTWVPNISILDRGQLEIGDLCMFGSAAQLTSHLVKVSGPIEGKKTKIDVYVRPVKIGKGCFIGSESKLLPSTVLEGGTYVEALTIRAGKREITHAGRASVRRTKASQKESA